MIQNTVNLTNSKVVLSDCYYLHMLIIEPIGEYLYTQQYLYPVHVKTNDDIRILGTKGILYTYQSQA